MPGFKGMSEGKMLKESVDEGLLEDLSKSSNKDLADWAKTTLAEYNKLMDKYYHDPIDRRLGFKNFSERLNKNFIIDYSDLTEINKSDFEGLNIRVRGQSVDSDGNKVIFGLLDIPSLDIVFDVETNSGHKYFISKNKTGLSKYNLGVDDRRLGFKNFSERLNKLFSKANEEVHLSTVIWLDGSGKVHEDQINYEKISKEASERYNTPVDQLPDSDIVWVFLHEAYPRFRITPFVKILKDGDNKEEVAAELKKMYNKKS